MYRKPQINSYSYIYNPQIIGHDNVKLRLQVKETLQIDHYAAHKSLNVNIDSFECKLW